MYYINSKPIGRGSKIVTTEYEFATKEEAEKKLDEILTIVMSEKIMESVYSYFYSYYISRRCTKDWEIFRKYKQKQFYEKIN